MSQKRDRAQKGKVQKPDPEIVKLPRPSIPAWLDEIPSWLDDSNLLASEFRVFCHVLRRESGKEGYGWCLESVPNQAKVCKLDPKTVRKCLQKLVKLGLLQSKPRHLKTTLYRIVPKKKDWIKEPF